MLERQTTLIISMFFPVCISNPPVSTRHTGVMFLQAEDEMNRCQIPQEVNDSLAGDEG